MAAFVFALLQLKKWKKNIRVILAFAILFILCLTMTNEYVSYSKEMDLSIQMFEPFILMFTQQYSLILITLIFLLLYQDVPFVDESTPYHLIRGDRKHWVIGQWIYIFISTFILSFFAFVVCTIAGASMSYPNNIWSETAHFTAYGGALNQSSPISLNLIEYMKPLQSVFSVFILIFLSTLMLNSILFTFNLWKGKTIGLVIVFFLIFISYFLGAFPEIADISGWFTITTHANLSRHRMGSIGTQPRVRDSVILLSAIIIALSVWTLRLSKTYNFFIQEKDT